MNRRDDRFSIHFPIPESPIDRLVRRRLEANARHVRLEMMLNAALDRPIRRLAVGLPAALAAALVIALFSIQPGGKVEARPAEVVEQARKLSTQPLDRAYLIEAQFSPAIRQRWPKLSGSVQERLWSRGDRFFVEAGEGRPAWGRDERGRVWFVLNDRTGLRFDADEIAKPFEEMLTLRHVEIPSLLSDVLRNCALTEVSSVDLLPNTRRIQATPIPGTRRGLESATLDIDTRSHIVRRLLLKRRLLGQSVASVLLTYLESRPRPDALYRVEGHLAAGGEIHDRANPPHRLRLLLRHQLGPLLRNARPNEIR